MRFFLPQVLSAVAIFFLPLAAQLVSLTPGAHGIESSKADTGTKQDDSPCNAQAWVRAEDLSPNHISEGDSPSPPLLRMNSNTSAIGELRVKVSRPECAHQVVSVVLRLQLKEFSEFVSLKNGVVLQWQAVNETKPPGDVVHEVVYDSRSYAEMTSDPNLWNVQAQERLAWTTEATLLDHLPGMWEDLQTRIIINGKIIDLTHPIVTPFTVSVPAVNYPPGDERIRVLRRTRHSWGDLSYEYTAVSLNSHKQISSQFHELFPDHDVHGWAYCERASGSHDIRPSRPRKPDEDAFLVECYIQGSV